MRIPLTAHIPDIDKATILEEGITSLALMERAATRLTEAFMEIVPDRRTLVITLSGPGGNGGDALAMARMLKEKGYEVMPYLLSSDRYTRDNLSNQQRAGHIQEVESTESLPLIPRGAVIVDGLFGSGLRRKLEGLAKDLVDRVNQSEASKVIAIDIPSGMMGEGILESDASAIRATHTLAIETPKLSELLAENSYHVGQLTVISINLSQDALARTETPYHLTRYEELSHIDLSRHTHDHKGSLGKGLLIAGKSGMTGAALLASSAALHSGIGLLSVHSSACNRQVLQSGVWEAIVSSDTCQECVTQIPDLGGFSAVAMGPGCGTDPRSLKALQTLLQEVSVPLVLDADALNMLSRSQETLRLLPKETILTPHPTEMDRLLGCRCQDSLERLEKARLMAQDLDVIICLKGAYTAVILPDGSCHMNTSGNAAMATAGSGDVLTGIILALLARGLSPRDAAMTGVWIHGESGNGMLATTGQNAMVARDLITGLGSVLKRLERRPLCPILWR